MKIPYQAKQDMTALAHQTENLISGRSSRPTVIEIRKGDIWTRTDMLPYLESAEHPGLQMRVPQNLAAFFRRADRKPKGERITKKLNPETGKPYLGHSALVALAHQILKRMGYPYILCEPGFRDEMPDAFGMSENMTCLIECKATRSDFLADRKKDFRIHPEKGIGQQRIYLVNKGVCTPEELPQGWQMIEAVDDHTVITEYGDLKKHWKDEYMFRERNLDSEYRLMCSWAYRREHGCLKDPPAIRIRCLQRPETENA